MGHIEKEGDKSMPRGTDVKLEAVNGIHMYTADEKRYPSVTTILDAVAMSKDIARWANWLGFQRQRYDEALEKTAVEGSYAHQAAQCIVDPEHGTPPVIRDAILDYYVRMRTKNLKMKLDCHRGCWDTIFTETAFVSHTYEIGGTMDWYAHWYGKKTLFDFKSSKAVRDKHLLQLGGYYLNLLDNGEEIDQAGIILIGRDNCKINVFDKPTIIKASEWFLKVYDYYKVHDDIQAAVKAVMEFVPPTDYTPL